MSDTGSLSSGRTLGRYELLIPIAEGGMASVWAARMKGQRGFQKIVAIKQMKPELSDDPNFETMFLDEASLVSRLKHPHLAEILDLGEENDMLYQVMEFVDGEPLNLLLRKARGGIPVPICVRIAREACGGLHAAHELRDENGFPQNLVHRDVSLQNILVTYDGVTKIIDFGVAKALSNAQKTSAGQVKGKVPYMSPEQIVSGGLIDRRSDIFALGIVLYQLVTGKHPFRGDTDLETMMHICEPVPAVPASRLFPATPAALDKVISKALEKDPNRRYSTMDEMLRALEVALPPGQHASSEDIAKFMREYLGQRGDQRRQAIQDAGRALDAAAGLAPTSGRLRTLPPGSVRVPVVPQAASGEGPISGPPNSGKPATIPPWMRYMANTAPVLQGPSATPPPVQASPSPYGVGPSSTPAPVFGVPPERVSQPPVSVPPTSGPTDPRSPEARRAAAQAVAVARRKTILRTASLAVLAAVVGLLVAYAVLLATSSAPEPVPMGSGSAPVKAPPASAKPASSAARPAPVSTASAKAAASSTKPKAK